MSKLVIAIIVLFALALSAGVVAGMLASRIPSHGQVGAAPGDVSSSGDSFLVDALQLNVAQRDQMRSIWEGAQSKVIQCRSEVRDLQHQRDLETAALLDEKQKAAFEAIAEKYKTRMDELVSERDKSVADAVQRTKGILNADQQPKYAQIIKDRLGTTGD